MKRFSKLLMAAGLLFCDLYGAQVSWAAESTSNAGCFVRQDLTAKSQGFLSRVLVRDGVSVKIGDALIELDSRILRNGKREAVAAVDQAKANEALAKDGVKRLQKMSGAESVTEQEMFQAKVRSSQAEAARKQAEAALERVEIQISDTIIKAEINGVVRGLPGVLGMFVQAGQSLGRIEADNQTCLGGVKTN